MDWSSGLRFGQGCGLKIGACSYCNNTLELPWHNTCYNSVLDNADHGSSVSSPVILQLSVTKCAAYKTNYYCSNSASFL